MKLEIGPGVNPTADYDYLDHKVYPGGPTLRYHCRCDGQLPIPDDSYEEVLAIHVLEHIHPTLLAPTLLEFRRILIPGGKIQIHVPNMVELCIAYLGQSDTKIRLELLDLFLGGERNEDGHKIMFEEDMLTSVLLRAGFYNVRELPWVRDRHDIAWEQRGVRKASLVMDGVKR